MMNQNTNTNAQALTTLTEAVTTMASAIQELVNLAKAESTVTTATTTEVTATTETATTATETTATTTTETTAETTEDTTATEATETTTTATTPIVVIDDDDNVIATTATADEEDNTEFKGSMINNDPCDPIPAIGEVKNQVSVKELDKIAENADKYLDNIICDISTLYDISTYALDNEGYNIDTNHSPYAPVDNRSGSFDNYKVYISKEIIKGDTDVTGEFRMIVSEKNSGVKIMDHSLKIINDHIKASSSENTVRMDKIKDSKKLMRFLEIVDEVSSLIMSKYISK